MVEHELLELLRKLIDTWENETIEFKRANDNFPTQDIGKYFSALSNEANLRGADGAWLIFGVDNKTRSVVGTDFHTDKIRLQSLKMEIARDADPSITFRNIHELRSNGLRVLMFEIPAAPRGIPIAWKGHYYSRAGESLTSLGLDKIDLIRQQTIESDWTAQVVAEATVSHLDDAAVEKAKELFSLKYANNISAEDVKRWSAETFLERVRLTRDSRITRAAILLLGKSSSAHLISPHPAQITYRLDGTERAYKHFLPPFLLNTTLLYQGIRNPQIRLLLDNSLSPVEMAKYDLKIVLEALHNCIAHQDYSRNGRIVVAEYQNKLVFENEGGFFEGNPDDYTRGDRTPRRYRNPFLAQAMAELNMIDTMGYGIFDMYRRQANRYFPMPDYELNDNSVRITIYGEILDNSYSLLLMRKANLPLEDIFILDRVQKKLPINETESRHLRRLKLLEGRKPNIRILTEPTEKGEKKSYSESSCIKTIIDYISAHGVAARQEIDRLLLDKLCDFEAGERSKKIANLLIKMRRAGTIYNAGTRKSPVWKIQGAIAE